MDLDILNLLANGNTTMAWLGAVALAAGGTAILVAGYIQIRRLRKRWTGPIWPARRPRRKPEAAIAATRSRPSDVPAPPETTSASTVAGLAAYRAVREAGPADPGPAPPADSGLEAMDSLLNRLRRAAEALEEIALKGGRLSSNNVGYDSFVTGMDVEYLHRQS